MAQGGQDWDQSRSAAGRGGPWVMTAIVSVGTFIEILDTSIANVALENISGNLGVSSDQVTWVVTSYLVANAIIIPISGFLSQAIGRKRYFMISLAIFSGSSLLCALSPNLSILVFARVLQGIGGGGLAPVEQSMITDSFPARQRGSAFAAFGFVVVIAPIIGPTIGGWITDTISWHWIFLINVPIGIIAMVLSNIFAVEAPRLVKEREERLAKGLKVDYIGFILLAVGLAGLLITLDQGQRDGWFSSPLIVTMILMAVLGLGGMVIWELNHDDPIVPLKLLAIPNFAISVLMMLLLGMLVFGTVQIIPQMLQTVFGYNAFHAGLTLTYGGAIAAFMMPVSGIVTAKVDTRALIFPAFAIQAVAFWYFAQFSTQSTFGEAAVGRFLSSVGLPFLFIPINTVAYVGLPANASDKASALLNFFRNLGGAFGISIAQTIILRRQQYHQSRITEGLNHLNPVFNDNLNQLTDTLGTQQQAYGVIYQQVQTQASMMSYIEVFHLLMWAVIFVLPFILLLKTASNEGGAPAGAH